MKLFFLTICFSFTASHASAALCSKAPDGVPCTPDPGEKTNRKKKEILEHISDAQSLNKKVEELKAAYVAVRGKSRSSDEYEKEYLACESYRAKKMAQDLLYKKAMDKTALLYHVGPSQESLTIGKPSDSSIGYVTGLSAKWNPQVADSGPGVYLAIKVDGVDGLSHITGAVSMDPKKPDGYEGITIEDGRVLILKGVFDIALENSNPGVLARVLYHESRHFNRLSRAASDGLGVRQGWASPEEEELIAYTADFAKASVFGLNETQILDLKKQRNKFAKAVRENNLSSREIDPKQENLWRILYWERQLNLEHEYANLKFIADKARREQEDTQKLARDERERLAREERERLEREKQERLAREALEREQHTRRSEEERLARERAAEAMWQDRDAAAAVCGYSPVYQRSTGIFLWYEAQNELGFLRQPTSTRLTTNEYRIAFLLSRACYGAEHDSERNPPRACNDAARLIHPFAVQGDGAARLDAMFGPDRGNRGCLYHIIAQSSGITDTASFDKVLAKYQKQLAKEKREYDKRWHSAPPRGNDGGRGGERPPREDNRRPADPDHDEVRRRIGGPFRP